MLLFRRVGRDAEDPKMMCPGIEAGAALTWIVPLKFKTS